MRFSEDLDFVTSLPENTIEKILTLTFKKMNNVCVAQFGTGSLEQKIKKGRPDAVKVFYIYRPEKQRERIAVKVEFEKLKKGCLPAYQHVVLRDVPCVSSMLSTGVLIMPYSSSIILVETGEEILSDKIRAIYERKYIKGRDIYDIWWLSVQLKIKIDWHHVKKKMSMYTYKFTPARKAGFFQDKNNQQEIINALQTDLPRFIPENIYSVYQASQFEFFFKALNSVTLNLLNQGMRYYLESINESYEEIKT